MANYHDEPSLRDRAPAFADRSAAGRVLSGLLNDYQGSATLVAAIPAGGVPVAIEVAARLQLDLDVLPVSKILLPWNTESGFGAAAFDGSVWVDERAVTRLGLSPGDVKQSTDEARTKVERRLKLLRGARPPPELKERSVIVIDDGIAAGSTMRTAVSALRRLEAGKIVVATPTGPAIAVSLIAEIADEVWCANVRAGPRFAVAEAYERWHDVGDAELLGLLKTAGWDP